MFVDACGKLCDSSRALRSIFEDNLDDMGPYQHADYTARKLIENGFPTTRCVFGSAGIHSKFHTGAMLYIKLNPEIIAYLNRAAFVKRFVSPGPRGTCWVFPGLAEDHKWKYLKYKGIRCPWNLRATMKIDPKKRLLTMGPPPLCNIEHSSVVELQPKKRVWKQFI